MILWTEDGMPVTEAARRLRLTPAALANWRRRFRHLRLQGLRDQLKPGRPRSVTEERIAELLDTALQRKPKAAARWSVRTLAAETAVSKSSEQRYLALFGVKPHRRKSFKLSTDPFCATSMPAAAAARCASDRRQLRHAQACQSEGLVRTPPALSSSLHADLRFMAQSGLSVGLV